MADTLAVEEPLELKVHGETLAITMRTPGDDHALALGFLFAEGLIRSGADVGAMTHCGRPGEEGYGNVLEISAASGAVIEVERAEVSRRGTLTTSACGVCGRRSVADLVASCGVLPPGAPVPASLLTLGPARLAERQAVFASTGGVHAAAALARSGEVLAFAEDVGRHNAVDKVVGRLLLDGRLALRSPTGAAASTPVDGGPALLVVSGRASFEMVQKAARARIPVVASVSAATSLAVDLAHDLGVSLATFVRDGAFNLCTHPVRISGLPR